MLGEPSPTEYDWKFQLLGVPVRVHPFFWLLAVLTGIRGGSSTALVTWVAAVFVSILVHEFGHVWAIQYFGWTPRVVLHGFGGLAIYDPDFAPWQSGSRPRRTTKSQIIISLAGPIAGFVLAAFLILLLNLTQTSLGYVSLFGNELQIGSGDLITNQVFGLLLFHLVTINILWGVLNLMPIYPLDGGQVARELFLSKSNDGLRMSLQLSVAMAVVLALVALVQFKSQYMAFMFGYLGYLSYQQLAGPYGGRRW